MSKESKKENKGEGTALEEAKDILMGNGADAVIIASVTGGDMELMFHGPIQDMALMKLGIEAKLIGDMRNRRNR